MSVQRDVVINVIKEAPSLSRPNFGLMMFAGYHNVFPNRSREYGSLGELVTAGFPTTHPIYKAVARAKAQRPSVRRFKVGRLAPFTKIVEIDVAEAVNGATYTVTINGIPFPYTADSSSSIQEIVEGLTALIVANVALPVTPTEDNATLTLTSDVAGADFSVELADTTGRNLLSQTDVTADRGIAAELNAIAAEDPRWYGLLPCDAFGAAEIEEIADWVEAEKRVCVCLSADTACGDALSTTDIMSTLKTASYERTTVAYTGQPSAYLNAGVMSRLFAAPLGSGSKLMNPAHKTIAGVPFDNLSSAQMSAIEAKNGNHYTEAGGSGKFRYGRMPNGEWLNTIYGTDWVESEATFDMYAVMENDVPFTQPGANMLGSTLSAVLQRGVRAGLFAADPAPEVDVPDVLDEVLVTAANRQDRILPGVEASARYAGAINRVTVTLRVGA